jgi:hypothetical protein
VSLYPLLAEPDLAQHLGFILAEEDALKQHLSGIRVPTRPNNEGNGNDWTDVGVWFRFPEGERQIKYPFVTIDLLGVDPAYDLFHSNHYWPVRDEEGPLYRPSYAKTLPTPSGGWAKMNFSVLNYLPYRLTWQVTHHARSSLHDRYLTSVFMSDVLPARPFWVYNEADGLNKRVERISMVAGNVPETTESGTKRIFRKIYTVTMLTEIPQERLEDSEVYRVFRVLIPVVERDRFDQYFKEILGEPPDSNLDPINQFSPEERAQAGELFHVSHEGRQLPTAT